MRIEYLEEFVALARFRNFTETASILNMSQPTLSKHINSLEHELRASLFERSGTTLQLSKAGQLVLPYAFDILDGRRQMEAAAHAGMSTYAPHIKFGGITALATPIALIHQVAEELKDKYGSDFVEILEGDGEPPRIIDMSRETAPEILFAYIDDTDEVEADTEVRIVKHAPMSIVVDQSHRLAGRESVTLDDLQQETFIKLEGNWISNSWRFIESFCLDAGFTPRCKHVYFPQVTLILKVTYALTHEVLILSNDYINQFHAFISDTCTIVPVSDPCAYLPLSIAYSMNNANPILDEVLEILLRDAPAIG